MAPPTPLAIATSSVIRLTKEESSYHTELAQQEARLRLTEASTVDAAGGDGNEVEDLEYKIRQERRAMDETRALFPHLRERIDAAVAKVESILEEDGAPTDPEEVARAKDAIANARSAP